MTRDRSMHDGSLPDPRPPGLPEPVTRRYWLVTLPNGAPYAVRSTRDSAEQYARNLGDGYSVVEVEPVNQPLGGAVGAILHAFAAKLTDLNDRNVRLGGQALSLGDPRDIATQIHGLGENLELLAAWGEGGNVTAEAIGAQVVAFLLARARVDELRVDAGGEAA